LYDVNVRRGKAASKAKFIESEQFGRVEWLICLALAVAVLLIYVQTAGFSFVNFDDPETISGNPHVRTGLTPENIRWALTSTEAANWLPLTRLTHLSDVSLFGMQAGPQHLVNAALHAIAAILLFLFLRRATNARWPSAFVAAVFAVHPLHVESVAWLSERKDVLCAVFWFLSLWAYARWAQDARRRWYAVALAAFCCGWAAKPMIVTLPVLLMLLDVWPLRRGLRIREKLPFFLISALGAAITLAAQSGSGAVQSIQAFPLDVRVENALLSYLIYIAKTIWPAALAVFYPYPRAIPLWEAAAAALTLITISIWTIRSARTSPYLAVGWWWFIVTLLPVIGLVQAGAQARADRYMYMSMVGLAIMAAWSVPPRRWTGFVAAAALLGFAAAAWTQASYWRNSGTLFTHAIAATGDNYLAEHNLGVFLLDEPGRAADAVEHLQRAVQLNPDNARAESDLGNALTRVPGRQAEAILDLSKSVSLQPDSAIAHNNLGNALAQAGRIAEATAEFETAIQLDPGYPDARANLTKVRDGGDSAEGHYNRGIALSGEGRALEAVREFEAALGLNPNYADAENNLGVALAQIPGLSAEALSHFRAAVRLRPDYADAHYNLGVALANLPGQSREALKELETAYRLHPDPQLRDAIDRLKR